MTTITSVQNGQWGSTSTWSTGTVPTQQDYVIVKHRITIWDNVRADTISIQGGGSLVMHDSWNFQTSYSLKCTKIVMARALDDNRVVRLDGLDLTITTPSISCIDNSGGTDGFPITDTVLNTANEVIIDDPGLYGFSSQMQDIKPEGCARAYARKVSNGVRYLNVIVHIRKDKGNVIGQLYRMAENPFQVLAVTNSAVIKGFIEAITPVDSVGKEYRAFRVSIAEGL